MRRSLIAASAALSLGGALAVASSASAASIPLGAANASTNSSLNGLLNQANTGLVQAQNLIVSANGLAQAGVGTPVDANFTSNITASGLTSAIVAEIGTDIAASSHTGQLELTICVGIDQTENPSDDVPTAVSNCETSEASTGTGEACGWRPSRTSLEPRRPARHRRRSRRLEQPQQPGQGSPPLTRRTSPVVCSPSTAT